MKKIIKSKEPKSLTSYRSTISYKDLKKSNIYEDFQEKTKEQCRENKADNLRKQLLKEQGYICCYCMSRIDCDNSKIEHFKPQTKNREFQIDYQNFFIACEGGEGLKAKEQCCDTKKGEKALQHIDLLSSIEQNIFYVKGARNISIKSINENIDKEINDVLNLNITVLERNRKEVYDSVMKNLKSRGYTIANIKRILDYYKNKHNEKFEPYCEMIVYFLSKKLKSKGVL
ncbi:MAG: TIGR02646 family protein [Epsilonproteobacteria bacterium]|nr:TIGR02646 family protein [Campylobacterota bacterium]